MTSELPDPMKLVLEESRRLGARSFTFAASGSRTARIHLEPERDYISNLRVFLSYTTADRAWADSVRDLLEGVGFQVSYLRNDLSPDKILSDDEVSQRLFDEIDAADYLCLLLSKNSAPRPWVRYEFQVAARLIGRVVLLKDHTVRGVADFVFPSFIRQALLTVKYQVLDFQSDPDMGLKLARMLLNDPDEGVTDGRYRPLAIRERNLKRENHFRRFARLHLDDLPLFRERHVVDVLPFSWREIGGTTRDVDDIVEWFVNKQGRLNLRVQLNFNRVNVTIIEIPMQADCLWPTGEPTVNALVVWKKEWNSAVDEKPNWARI